MDGRLAAFQNTQETAAFQFRMFAALLAGCAAPRQGLASAVLDGRWYIFAGGPIVDVSTSDQVDIFTP